MLVINKVSKAFDENIVLAEVSATILQDQRIGIVGDNGSGKTTLIKIISGEIKQDSGQVEFSGSVEVLPQVMNFKNQSVYEFLEQRLKSVEDSYLIDIVLQELIPDIDKNLKVSKLSEGQKTKLYLASISLYKSGSPLLILDEPTNNLDHQGLLWLEDFVNSYQGSVIIISHDRYFLDKTVSKIWHIEHGKLTSYNGNYSEFVSKRLVEREIQLKKFEQNQKEAKRLERLIIAKKEAARQIANEKEPRDNDKYAKYFFAQKSGTIDRQAKNFESRLEHLEKVEKPEGRKDYNFGFSGEVDHNKLILRVTNLSARYIKEVFSHVNFEVRGGERIQISGINGSGKSTLLKVVLGEQIEHSGVFEYGVGVRCGYFSQDASGLDSDATGLDLLKATRADMTDCFTFASYMHLTQDDLKKKVNKLSRGQIAKLAFVKLLLSNLQLLVLDEPTNHLDVDTREDIENALSDYCGSILFVSHDRYFCKVLNPNKIIQLS